MTADITPVKTISSLEFLHNVSAARRVVREGGTVLITDRGTESMALIPITEYRRLTKTGKNLIELLSMPDPLYDEVDFEPARIGAQDVP